MIAMSILSTILGAIVGLCGYTAFRLSPFSGKKLYSRINAQYPNVNIAIYLVITLLIVTVFFILIQSEFKYITIINFDIHYLFSNKLFSSFILGIILGYILSVWYRITSVPSDKRSRRFKFIEFRLGATALFLAIVAMFLPLLQGAVGRIENVSGAGFSLTLSDISKSKKEEEFWSGSSGWLTRQAFPEFASSKRYLEIVGQISNHIDDDLDYINIISEGNEETYNDHEETKRLFGKYIIPVQKCMIELIYSTYDPQYLYDIFSDFDHQVSYGDAKSISLNLDSLSGALLEIGGTQCITTGKELKSISEELGLDESVSVADSLQSFWTSVPYGVMAVSFLVGSGGARETAALTLTRWLSGFYDDRGNRKFQVGEDGLLKRQKNTQKNFVVKHGENKSSVVRKSGNIHAWYLIRTMMYLETLLDDLGQGIDKYNVTREYISIMKELFHHGRGDSAEYLESTDKWIEDCVNAEYVNEKTNSLIFTLISRENNLIRTAIETGKFDERMLSAARRNAELSVDCIMEVPGLKTLSAAMFFSAGFKATFGELLMRIADRRKLESNIISEDNERRYRMAYNVLNSAHMIYELVEEENKPEGKEYSFQSLMNIGKEINKKKYVSEMMEYIKGEIDIY